MNTPKKKGPGKGNRTKGPRVGNKTKGPRKGRPPTDGITRVTLVAQRVLPETLETLQKWAKKDGGIGRAIDNAVILAKARIQQFNTAYEEQKRD